jgi:hypothetical protein
VVVESETPGDFFGGSREFFVYGFEFENLLCYTG